MSKLVWDATGARTYETGVDHGVLYIPDENGDYSDGVAWNGLTTVTETPSGAEANAQYADNIKYLNLYSAEEFAATIEAFTYPDEFQQFDGLAIPTAGVAVGQQGRGRFGLSYRTLRGNDLQGNAFAYKLHLVYGCTANPSERAYATVSDSPEAIAFSWEIATVPALVTDMLPTSLITIDSSEVDADALAALELILYGDLAVDPRLPLPDEVLALFSDTVTEATPTEPSFNSGTNTITIPSVTGVNYLIGGAVQAPGAVVITADTVVTARPKAGYVFTEGVDDDWLYEYTG